MASGKGGTGKTLVATSLALVAEEGHSVTLADADVEAPNAGLFLHPRLDSRQAVEQMIPRVDEGLCTHCGRCAEVCQFNAIASLPSQTMVFGELCHGCGSCALICPVEAIEEIARGVGTIEAGSADGLRFAQGTLNVGEAMATPVIRALKHHVRDSGWESGDDLVIYDAPPGTACPVVETLRDADVTVLVTEPTPFGLHDLDLAVQVARDVLGLPVGVVINRDDGQDSGVERYCRDQGLPIWLHIPLRREIAVAYAEGVPLVRALPEYRPGFSALLAQVLLAGGRGAS